MAAVGGSVEDGSVGTSGRRKTGRVATTPATAGRDHEQGGGGSGASTSGAGAGAGDAAGHTPVTHSGRRSGLGRGLAALIPESQDEEPSRMARPLDVLFPAREESATAGRARGGSARDLLNPPAKRGGARRRAQGQGESRAAATPNAVPRAGRGTGGLFGAVLDEVDVSRETSTVVPEAGAEGADARTTGSGEAIVSRETSAVVAEPAGGNGGTPRSGEAIVSRETSGPDRRVRAGAPEGGSPEGTDAPGPGLVAVPGTTFAEVPLAWIIPNTRQPREVFDEDELEELAASIREVGVLQPVVVRPIDVAESPSAALVAVLAENPEARYELIMGERRLRACEIAGQVTIPAIVRRTEDEDLLRDALLENLHRAQLNPLEEASAYQQLMVDFGATQEELSKRIARSRPQIANTLRLLRLPAPVQRKVAAGILSAGHARALLALGSPEDMESLAERIVSEGLSVRTTEELVRIGQTRPARPATTRSAPGTSARGVHLQTQLSEAWDTRVTVTEGRRKGRIVIEFAGEDDLERLAALMLAQE